MSNISFVIINDDAAEYCTVLFDSLKKQKDSNNIELVFIDNHSADESVKLAANFGIRNIYSFDSKTERRGLLYNKGSELSSGDYIIFAHSDILLRENFFSNVYRYIKNNPDVDFVNFSQYYLDHVFLGNNYIGMDIITGNFFYHQLFDFNPNVKIACECSEACFMVKRDVFNRNVFNADYFNSFYEYDFIYRIKEDHKNIEKLNESAFMHYFIEWHEKNKSLEQDRLVFLAKHGNKVIKHLLRDLHRYKKRDEEIAAWGQAQLFRPVDDQYTEANSIRHNVPIGEWTCAAFVLTQPILSTGMGLRIDPRESPGLLRIRRISIYSESQPNNLIFNCSTNKDFAQLTIDRTMVRLPSEEGLLLAATDSDPKIFLPPLALPKSALPVNVEIEMCIEPTIMDALELMAIMSEVSRVTHSTAAERDGQIAGLNQAVAERDAQNISLNKTIADLLDKEVDSLKQIAQRDEQIAGLNQAVAERDAQNISLNKAIADLDKEVDSLKQVVQRDEQIASLNQSVTERDSRIAELIAERTHILNSKSWRITMPLRAVRRNVVDKPYRLLRKIVPDVARQAWIKLPLSIQNKLLLKHKLFNNLPFVFRWSQAYRSWAAMNAPTDTTPDLPSNHCALLAAETLSDVYVPLLKASPLKDIPVKLIAFYLPQFHAIPENNAWWGDGFTEWVNVRKALPLFNGHYQPHEPEHLGYYNLLDPMVQHRQVELAKLYGIGGFCFYFYWFGGKRLLEKPIENYLDNRKLDLPFCLCWANENWTRCWDGLDNDILIAQQYSSEDDLAFIQHVSRYMRDDRYIRISGKPLLVVYRPNLFPSARKTVKRWRDWCRNHGLGEIYIAYTQSFETVDPEKYGFNAAIEFPPNNSSPPIITDRIRFLNHNFGGMVYDWQIFVERSRTYVKPDYALFRSVCPSWDSTARKNSRGGIFINNSPRGYQEWLRNAIADTCDRIPNVKERLVFINAWNEWGEGSHLEPDKKYGYAFLEATRQALIKS